MEEILDNIYKLQLNLEFLGNLSHLCFPYLLWIFSCVINKNYEESITEEIIRPLTKNGLEEAQL